MIKFVNGQAIEMTEEERTELMLDGMLSNEQRIERLKALLRESDYKTLKYIEGALSDMEHIEVCEQRAAWRAMINELGG